MFRRMVVASILIVMSPMLAAQEEEDHATHEELRGLLSGIETAINTEQYGDLAQYFHENLRITTINQEIIRRRTILNRTSPGGLVRAAFSKNSR